MKLGVIGDNIAASRAPRLHRLAGELTGLDVSYDLLVPRELGHSFDVVFDHCASTDYRGINITYPYKELAVARVTIDDPLVRAMAAINTVVFDAGGPKGYNTDYSGFVAAYRAARGDTPPGVVCQIGAGGVGKAVGFGLLAAGLSEIRLLERDLPRAHGLADALRIASPSLRVVVTGEAEVAAAGATAFVNCTPVGMIGFGGIPMAAPLMHGAHWAFDAVYTPVDTPFLAAAGTAGAKLISGYELFFHQGVHAFEIFAERDVDAPALRAALAG